MQLPSASVPKLSHRWSLRNQGPVARKLLRAAQALAKTLNTHGPSASHPGQHLEEGCLPCPYHPPTLQPLQTAFLQYAMWVFVLLNNIKGDFYK